MIVDRWLPGIDDDADGPIPRVEDAQRSRLVVDEDAGHGPPPRLPVAYAVAGCAAYLRAASTGLQRLDVAHRIAALSRVARSWLDPLDEHRRAALERLPDELGSTEEAVAWALDATFETWTSSALRAWWDRSGPRGPVPAGPTAHIWAGNVFTSGLPPVAASLLAGIPALIKAPGRLPTFAALFARSVAHHAPELGPCVGAAAWTRADARATSGLLAAAVDVFAFGDDASLDAIEALTVGARVHRFGDRYSIAVGRGDDALPGLADDVLAYDGLGCLTPRWLFVPGDLDAAIAVARAACAPLAAAARRLPARPLDAAAGARRAGWLGTTGFLGWSDHGEGWAVAATTWEPEQAPPPRCLHVVAVPDPSELPALLSPLGPRLQGCAVLPVDGPSPELLDALSALGLSRAAPAGRLQRPPVDWNHDDVDPLAVLGPR